MTFISVGESANDGVYGFLDTANYILDLSNPPSVMTTSYGSNEEYISSSVAKYVQVVSLRMPADATCS